MACWLLCRKNANHPDLITGPFEQSIVYPPPDELIKESGKMQLLERMLNKLHAEGHKARAPQLDNFIRCSLQLDGTRSVSAVLMSGAYLGTCAA